MEAGIPTWLIFLGTALGGGAVWQASASIFQTWRTARVAEAKDERDAELDAVRAVAAWRMESAEAAERAREADHRANESERTARKLRDDFTDLAGRVQHLESDATHLTGFLVVVKAGIEAGTIPPWPDEPPTIRAILAHITSTEQEQP